MDMYNSRFLIIPVLVGLFCVLKVNSQNAFISQPESATVDQGVDHVLECSVNKTYLIGLFFVAWIRENVVIGERNVIEKDGLSQFIGNDQTELNRYAIIKIEQGNVAMYNMRIANTKGVDTGEYQCVICEHPATSYECTTITQYQSNVATYTVKYTPSAPEYPQCTGLDGSATVSVGTEVEVTCASEIGDPKVDLKWDRNGVTVDAIERLDLDNNRLYLVYTFTAALLDTGIVLQCSASSSKFTAYSESCSFSALTVVDMPVVTVTSGAEEYEEGSEANFTCRVSSATTISFAWTVGNIPSDRYTQVDLGMESVIKIASVESGDHRSVIRCTVTNSQGQTAQDQVIMEVVGGPTGIIPTSRVDPTTRTKAMPTTAIVPTTTAGGGGGSIGAAVGGAVAGFVIILLLILTFLYCYKKRKYQEEKNPPGKVMSIGAPQNGIGNQALPAKKFDDDDDVKKEPLPISDEPDVVPRQHNGNHDPRTWWRESMPGDAYAKEENEYPTIKRMQMPFTQRQPSLENLQERVEMDNYRSSSNDYDDLHSDGYRDTQNMSPAEGRYDYAPSPSVHGENMSPHPQVNNYHDYHNPQFDRADNYHRPPSVDHYSDYSYPQEDPRIQHARSPVNYGAPPPERFDSYRDYGSYDRRNPANYGHRPGIDNPSYKGEYHENDMYGRNPNYPDNYDPGFSEDGSVFSSATDRYYEQDPRIEGPRSAPYYPDNNGYASSDRPISPYADIPQGQTNTSSDVLYMQGHELDTSDPSYV